MCPRLGVVKLGGDPRREVGVVVGVGVAAHRRTEHPGPERTVQSHAFTTVHIPVAHLRLVAYLTARCSTHVYLTAGYPRAIPRFTRQCTGGEYTSCLRGIGTSVEEL